MVQICFCSILVSTFSTTSCVGWGSCCCLPGSVYGWLPVFSASPVPAATLLTTCAAVSLAACFVLSHATPNLSFGGTFDSGSSGCPVESEEAVSGAILLTTFAAVFLAACFVLSHAFCSLSVVLVVCVFD